jgi:hypothetical protein
MARASSSKARVRTPGSVVGSTARRLDWTATQREVASSARIVGFCTGAEKRLG